MLRSLPDVLAAMQKRSQELDATYWQHDAQWEGLDKMLALSAASDVAISELHVKGKVMGGIGGAPSAVGNMP